MCNMACKAFLLFPLLLLSLLACFLPNSHLPLPYNSKPSAAHSAHKTFICFHIASLTPKHIHMHMHTHHKTSCSLKIHENTLISMQFLHTHLCTHTCIHHAWQHVALLSIEQSDTGSTGVCACLPTSYNMPLGLDSGTPLRRLPTFSPPQSLVHLLPLLPVSCMRGRRGGSPALPPHLPVLPGFDSPT